MVSPMDMAEAHVFGLQPRWINRSNNQFDKLNVHPDIIVKD